MRPGNWGTTRYGWSRTWPAGPARSWRAELAQNRQMDLAPTDDEAHPPVVAGASPAVLTALASHEIIAVPNVGGYSLAVRAGSPEAEARLEELAADPDGPHYAVGQIDDVRELTSGWTDELRTLLQRCWPGPVEVFLPSAGSAGSAGGPADPDTAGGESAETSESETHGDPDPDPDPDPATAASNGRHAVADDGEPEYGAWAVVVGMPDGRALRRLCREQGPWRTVPLRFTEPEEVARAFRAADVAVVVDGGRREGPLPTVVDATVTPIRVLREGALPTSFIEWTMLMSTRRKLFSRTKRPAAG
jgi:tRNA A37 threonylcarbamoyladenosine synthetase subunit TsaC/SUA5/YrdC